MGKSRQFYHRVPKGVPTGGEFAEHQRTEPETAVFDANWAQAQSRPRQSMDARDFVEADDDARIAAMDDRARAQLLEAEAQALDPDTDAQTLRHLAGHPESLVRSAVAANPNLDERALVTMRDDPNPFVREQALANPSLPKFALAQYVASEADPQELRMVWGADRDDPDIASALAANEATPSVVLTDLASTDDEATAVTVAAHPAATNEMLNYLAVSGSEKVRAAAAANPNVPARSFHRLVRDPSESVQRAVDAVCRTPSSRFYDGRDVREAEEAAAAERQQIQAQMPVATAARKPSRGRRVARFAGRMLRGGTRIAVRVVAYMVLRRSFAALMRGHRR